MLSGGAHSAGGDLLPPSLPLPGVETKVCRRSINWLSGRQRKQRPGVWRRRWRRERQGREEATLMERDRGTEEAEKVERDRDSEKHTEMVKEEGRRNRGLRDRKARTDPGAARPRGRQSERPREAGKQIRRQPDSQDRDP